MLGHGVRLGEFLRKDRRLQGQLLVGMLVLCGAGCATQNASMPSKGESSSPQVFVRELSRGQIECFEPGAMRDDKPDVPAYCETSAVVRDNGSFWVASDKPLPQKKGAAVFALAFSSPEKTLAKVNESALQDAPFDSLRKIEAMAHSSRDGWVFASTAFDRIAPDKPAWDAFNTLVAWPVGKPLAAQVIEASTRAGVTSSVSLRKSFSRALADSRWPEGPPYYKVEGLAALPEQRLVFGVREAGASYKDFTYEIRLIEARYRVEDGQVRLDTNSFQEVYRAAPTHIDGHQLAVSSLLYDETRNLLWMLTSFEEDDGDLGAYLMHAPADDFTRASAWQVVREGESETPFVFANKAEGMEFVGPNMLVVVFDEDRRVNTGATEALPMQVARAENQGAYMLMEVVSGQKGGAAK